MITNAGSDAELAVAAAQAGAAVVLRMFGTPLARVAKADGDFATAADLESEKTILEVLRAARPADAMTGEESGRSGANDTERTWLIDPICGTLNYAARTMLVAVNVALRAGSEIVAAASADPFAGEVFWTDGNRACLRHGDTDYDLVPSAGSLPVGGPRMSAMVIWRIACTLPAESRYAGQPDASYPASTASRCATARAALLRQPIGRHTPGS